MYVCVLVPKPRAKSSFCTIAVRGFKESNKQAYSIYIHICVYTTHICTYVCTSGDKKSPALAGSYKILK